MSFLIRYIYNNVSYYKPDGVVKILVKLRPPYFLA